MSPVPHTTAAILWTSLAEGYDSMPVWFVFLLAFIHQLVACLGGEEKHRAAIWVNFASMGGLFFFLLLWWSLNWWLAGIGLRGIIKFTGVSWSNEWVSGFARCRLHCGERMRRCKAKPPHRSHSDPEALCRAKWLNEGQWQARSLCVTSVWIQLPVIHYLSIPNII